MSLKQHNGYLLLIYRLSKSFDRQIQDEIRRLIDEYLIEQIDYELPDFHFSEKSFQKFYDFILNIDHNEKQDKFYENMLDAANNISLLRSQIETQVREKIPAYQWFAALALVVITLWTFYEMSGSSVAGIIATTISTGALLLLVLVLKESDSLKFNNYKWTWQPLRELFLSLNLLPYFPGDLIASGEVKLLPNEVFREASYANKYPNMNGKTVKIIKNHSKK